MIRTVSNGVSIHPITSVANLAVLSQTYARDCGTLWSLQTISIDVGSWRILLTSPRLLFMSRDETDSYCYQWPEESIKRQHT